MRRHAEPWAHPGPDVQTSTCNGIVAMPDRARRAGARRGAVSPELRAAVRREAELLAGGEDPVEVVRQVGDFFAGMDSELERVAKVRLRAVARLRTQGWSYDRISRATGLSKARVAQLVKDDRQPRRVKEGSRVPREGTGAAQE